MYNDDEDWDQAFSNPPAPVVTQQRQNETEWHTGYSQTFTNSNRSRGRGGNRSRGRGGGGGFRSDRGRRGNTGGWREVDAPNVDGGGWREVDTGNNSEGWGWNNSMSRGSGTDRTDAWNNDSDNRRARDQNRSYEKFEIIKVPSKMVGRVIGRGGSKIDELQRRSLAKVQVTKNIEGDDTEVKIFGEDDQIAKAIELIDELIEEKPRPPPPIYKERTATPPPPVDKNSEPFNWKKHMQECDALIEAEWNKLPPIIKNFYEEHPEVTAMSQEEVDKFREENNNIVVARTFPKPDSKPVPKPVKTFEQAFHNYPEILEEIRKAGFEKPSPIQAQAWPVLLSGEDLIGIAQTGTGKTLAFLLPALLHIDGQTIPREERGGPAVLIMAPTRELALQIDKEVKKYYYRGITSTCVYGGGDRKAQVAIVTKGVDIVIATPGRMNDLHQAGHLSVKSVTYVVLDEADRMLDMGFEPQIRKVMYSLRPTRQSIMTSATWPPGVRRLADSYMNDPIQIYVGSLDLAATHTVKQTIQILTKEEKEDAFMDFIYNMGPDDKVIVFCGTKAMADYLSVELALKDIACASLHSNKDQCDREQAVEDIKDGTVKILIATDVASRGLDIDDVTHVFNYDFPKNIEEYVHRVGRTGRAGKTGESISFFTRQDWMQAAELIKILEEAEQYVPEEIYSMAERYEEMKERRESNRGSSGGRRGGFSGGGRRW